MTRNILITLSLCLLSACAGAEPPPVEEVEAPVYWTPCTLLSGCSEEHGTNEIRPVQGSPCGPTYPDLDNVQCLVNGPEGWAYAPGLRGTVASSGACSGEFVESGLLQWRCGDRRTCDHDAPCLPLGE